MLGKHGSGELIRIFIERPESRHERNETPLPLQPLLMNSIHGPLQNNQRGSKLEAGPLCRRDPLKERLLFLSPGVIANPLRDIAQLGAAPFHR